MKKGKDTFKDQYSSVCRWPAYSSFMGGDTGYSKFIPNAEIPNDGEGETGTLERALSPEEKRAQIKKLVDAAKSEARKKNKKRRPPPIEMTL